MQQKDMQHFRFQNISSVHFTHVIYSILTQQIYYGEESRENNLWYLFMELPTFIEGSLSVAINRRHLSFVITDTLPAACTLEMYFITKLST